MDLVGRVKEEPFILRPVVVTQLLRPRVREELAGLNWERGHSRAVLSLERWRSCLGQEVQEHPWAGKKQH